MIYFVFVLLFSLTCNWHFYSILFVDAQTCNAGTCWDGSVCASAPAGRYSTGGVKASCVDCPAGRYGTGGSTTSSCTGPVNAGYYSLLGGGTSVTGSGSCDAGRYGTGGSTTSQCTGAVNAGRYSDPAVNSGVGATTTSGHGACNAGRWGSAGAISAQCSGPCAAGRYGTGGSTANTCTGAVAAGRWSDPAVAGDGATTTSGHGPCDAGRWGAAGATSSQCGGPCNPGRYSAGGLAGSSGASCTTCVAGKYNPNSGSTSANDCLDCPAGYYCVAAQTTGTLNLCAAGRYGDAGMSTSSCTGACPAGYYCPAGSISLTNPAWGTTGQGAIRCGGAPYYCPGGNSGPLTVPGGYYGTPTAAPTTQTGYTACNSIGNYYCVDGIENNCPAGKYTYAYQGASYYSYCRDCVAGTPCPNSTKTPTTTIPSKSPTPPTKAPTLSPTTSAPTLSPSLYPTISPTRKPVSIPTDVPTTYIPTLSPTTSTPSLSPSLYPTTFVPTMTPTPIPSLAPATTSPMVSPTSKPTINPTKSPTKVPTSAPQSPSNAPTVNPTHSPFKAPDVYVAPKADCHQYTESAKCNAETNSECGVCAYFSERIKYGFRVRVDFVMDKGVRFIDFDNVNANPPKTAFRDAVKTLIKSQLNGQDKITINRIGQIYQVLGTDLGNSEFEIYFDDSDSDRAKTKVFFTSKPNLYDYLDDLNFQLNKKMKTTGKKYITGKINIDRLNIVDLAPGKGSCGCSEEVGSSAIKVHSNVRMMIAISTLIAFQLH